MMVFEGLLRCWSPRCWSSSLIWLGDLYELHNDKLSTGLNTMKARSRECDKQGDDQARQTLHKHKENEQHTIRPS